MTAVDLIELMLRGAALGIYIALFAHTLLWAGRSTAARLFAITCFAGSLYVFFATPDIHQVLGSWTHYAEAIGTSSITWVWMTTLAIFDDNFRWKNWRLAAPLLVGAGNLTFSLFPDIPNFYRMLQLLVLVPIVIDTLRVAISNTDDDLIASRRRLSRAFRTIVPMIVLAISAIALYEVFQLYIAWIRIGVALLLIGVTLSLMVVLSRMDSRIFPDYSAEQSLETDQLDLTAADRLDLQKLEATMSNGGYLNGRLTIATLAQSLDIPEHRLRKLINQHLGYRNFTAYLNKYRIDEAMRRLADPTLVRTQITNLAFDIGYGSLAPFNRAFKQRTGVSPTEWRETTLANTRTNEQVFEQTA